MWQTGGFLIPFCPLETRKRFSDSVTLMEDQGQGVSATAGKGNQGDTTYRQVIRWSEDQMAEWGNRMTVTIVATLGGCGVESKPGQIGGPELDAGATKIVKRMEPRWYSFLMRL